MSTSVLLELGESFDGKFVILESLGSGGMGEVYKCRQVGVERLIALKLLNRTLTDTEQTMQRFEREAKILSLLDHRGIARFFMYGVAASGVPFIAMEYVEGESLRHRLQQLGSIAWRDALNIAIKICSALSYAHESSVIHRDLKPDNIILSDSSRPVIIDFGLAKVADPNWDSYTRTGDLIGTTNYLSPELCRGFKPDHRSDLYSLGIILYEMIGGEPPFIADHPMGVIYKHAHATIPKLSITELNLPTQINWIIGRCIAKEPDERYQSAADLSADLQAVLNDRTGAILPPGKREERSGARNAVLLTLFICLTLILGCMLFAHKEHKKDSTSVLAKPRRYEHPRKLTSSDSQLREIPLESLIEQFDELHKGSHQNSEALALVQSWVSAKEKIAPLDSAELTATSLAKGSAQIALADLRGALETHTNALKLLNDNSSAKNSEKVRLLGAQIGNGINLSEFVNGKPSRLEIAAKQLKSLLNFNDLSEAEFESAVAQLITAEITIGRLNEALSTTEQACHECPNCTKSLSRFKAECLFRLGRIEEAKRATLEYASHADWSDRFDYRIESTGAHIKVNSAMNAARVAAGSNRYDIAMEFLQPVIEIQDDFTDPIYAEALLDYADYSLHVAAGEVKGGSDKKWLRAIETSKIALNKAARISKRLDMQANERRALAKLASLQLWLGDEKDAKNTLEAALQGRNLEAVDDAKANLVKHLWDNLSHMQSYPLSRFPVRFRILDLSNEIAAQLKGERFSTLSRQVADALAVERAAQKK